jgi:hypothetical protein
VRTSKPTIEKKLAQQKTKEVISCYREEKHLKTKTNS